MSDDRTELETGRERALGLSGNAKFKSLEELFYSTDFGHIDGHEWSMDEVSLLMLWDWFNENIEER